MELCKDVINSENIKHEEVTEEFVENHYCEIPSFKPVPLKVESNKYKRISVSCFRVVSFVFTCI